MQLNGVELVAVKTPAPAPIHPSLPAKPVHSVATSLPGSGGGASEVVTTKRGISVIGGSAQSILDSRRANRMANINANLDAAEALKRELAASTAEETPEEPATAAEVTPPIKSDPAVSGEPDEYVEADGLADPDTPRGKKRKAIAQEPLAAETPVETENGGEDDDDEDAEGEDDDDEEDPPNPEADQPISKKSKLKVNPDGTVDYEDTVMYVIRSRFATAADILHKGYGSLDIERGIIVKSLV